MQWLLKLFGEESPVGRFLNRMFVIVASNLLFVLFSVPVVTIGASLSALNYTMMKYRRGDRHFKVASMFWRGFRESFAKATVCFVVYGLLMLFQVLEISWCRQFTGPVALFQYALVGLMVLETIVAICVALYVVPLVATYATIKYLPLWAFLWLMFGFALIVYLASGIMLRQFMPFLPEVDICGDIIPPDMEGDPNIMVGEDHSSDDVDEKTLQEMMKYGL